MGDAQEIQLHIRGHASQGIEGPNGSTSHKDHTVSNQHNITAKPIQTDPVFKHWKWWFLVLLNIFFLLAGQTVATLLGWLYYNQGGNSKWMATLVQSAGSPLLVVPLLLFPSPSTSSTVIAAPRPPFAKIISIYIALGLLIAGDNLMYSYGLLYLPVSTYSLICATQLAFNAVFSYFFNNQKFTSLIFNSVVLLTFSAALLGVNSNSSDATDGPKTKFAQGFMLTLGASALFSLILSLMQLAFQKVIRTETFSVVLEMQFWTSIVAACASVIGLFASGEWRTLGAEMDVYVKGKVSYVMTLVWTAISWQVSAVGTVGLIFVVSSLFANVISILALPLVPIFAVIFFHDKIDGVKVVAMLIAVWGLLSYIYQHYLDDLRAKKKAKLCDVK